MNTELLRKILDKARDDASPSDAMLIEDLGRGLEPLFAVLETEDCDEPMDLAAYVTDFKALSSHALSSENGIDESEEGYSLINADTFSVWIEKLWKLAQ